MKKPRLHLICNAHLDPVWQWRWEEGCAEALATFRSACEILGEDESLIFNHNEALLYQWVETYDSALFRKIQRLVNEGRWSIAGGWYLQPDLNLAGLESLLRHVSLGRSYFKEKFNAEPLVAYNFDSFGHSGGLPQVLRKSGYRMYIHMRPQPQELALPSDLYRWRGVDGSEVIGLRIAVGLYHTERDNIEQRLKEAAELAFRLNRDVPVFWGLGNHGGGATREDLKRIEEFSLREKRVEVKHSTPDRLYQALKGAARDAPVVEGGLQRVFTGCYTSLSRVKRGAQKSLARLVQAEALRTLSWWGQGQVYPREELEDAWKGHLFNDFHDILTGTCTQPAEQDALDLYGRTSETVKRLRLGVAVSLNLPPSLKTAIPVTVLNANPSCTEVPVEVECMADYRPLWSGTWHLRLFKHDGTEIPCQEEQPEALLPFNGWRRKVSFLAALPGLGRVNFRLEVSKGRKKTERSMPSIKHRLEQRLGLVCSLDLGEKRELLGGPLFQPLVVEDSGDSWGTGLWSFRKVAGCFERRKGMPPQIIQTGPVRMITESVLVWNRSRIVCQTIAYTGWPVLEFRLRIQWNEERKRLKLRVPTVLEHPQLFCEIPGGAASFPSDGQEHVHGRWFLLRGEVGGREGALAVVNSGQHGLDFRKGEVQLSVLRSAAYCHEKGFELGRFPARKYMDQGEHEVRLLVTAGDPGRVRSLLPGLSDWLSAPPLAYAHLPLPCGDTGSPSRTQSGKNAGSQGWFELFSLDPGTVWMTACKQSRDKKSLVIRLHEALGVSSETTLRLTMPRLELRLNFMPFEIKTIRIEKDGTWKEANLIDEC